MENRFEGQTVVVTGGTRGLGRAMSLGFLVEGARVFALYQGNEKGAEELRDLAGQRVGQLECRKCDVSKENAVEHLWEELQAEGVSVLVNNAGIRRDALVALMKLSSWDEVMRVNLTSGFLMAKFAVKAMLGARYGRILFVTSPSGPKGMPGQGNYGASKMGQVGLARSLCREVGRKGITVNCVSPGFIETELVEDLSSDDRNELRRVIAARRFGSPEEVAAGVLFLASKEASYVNGAVLEVTGGL